MYRPFTQLRTIGWSHSPGHCVGKKQRFELQVRPWDCRTGASIIHQSLCFCIDVSIYLWRSLDVYIYILMEIDVYRYFKYIYIQYSIYIEILYIT